MADTLWQAQGVRIIKSPRHKQRGLGRSRQGAGSGSAAPEPGGGRGVVAVPNVPRQARAGPAGQVTLQKECPVPRSPGVLGSADTGAAGRHMRSHGSFATTGEDPAAGVILPSPGSSSCSSHGALGARRRGSGVLPGAGGACGLAFPPVTALGSTESWGWLPGSAPR